MILLHLAFVDCDLDAVVGSSSDHHYHCFQFIHLGGPNNNSANEKSSNETVTAPAQLKCETVRSAAQLKSETIAKTVTNIPAKITVSAPLTSTVAPRIVNITPGIMNHTTATLQTLSTASNIGRVSANSNPATVTVVNASGSSATPTKTIVVVPVSATAIGSGDAQLTAKRLKTN